MESNVVSIVEIEDPSIIVGGDIDPNLLAGAAALAFGAGIIGTGGLLGIAAGVAAAVTLYESGK